MNELLPSFYDELEKISKAKLSDAEETADSDNASRTLDQATKTVLQKIPVGSGGYPERTKIYGGR